MHPLRASAPLNKTWDALGRQDRVGWAGPWNRNPTPEMLYIELAITAALILVNGILAMSELAVVSSRPAKLKSFAERGRSGARRALALATDPGRFLSTVQIGITLVGVLSGAFSGATLGLRLTGWLLSLGLPEAAAEALGVGSVVAAITYLSLIMGELVPKQIALRNPEGVAVRVAPAMTLLQKLASPLVTVLDLSGKLVLRLMGQRGEAKEGPTDDEIRAVIAEAEGAGVLEAEERRMISGVMRLGDRSARGVMTPRTDIEWLDLSAPLEEQKQVLMATPHSRLPAGPSIDELNGAILARDVLAAVLAGQALNLTSLVRAVPVVYEHSDALDVLAVLRSAEIPMALVHDEYGHFEGVVTPADILGAIAGEFRSGAATPEPDAVQREDGSWLLAGDLAADEMAETLGISLPEPRSYQTTAGFVLALAQRLPATGDAFKAYGWRFEVVDLDGRRIDKVLASRLAQTRRDLIR